MSEETGDSQRMQVVKRSRDRRPTSAAPITSVWHLLILAVILGGAGAEVDHHGAWLPAMILGGTAWVVLVGYVWLSCVGMLRTRRNRPPTSLGGEG